MMFNAPETKNESICIFGIFRGRGACGKSSQCDRTNDQSNCANYLATCRGKPQRASDGRKAGCDRTRGAAGRSTANRFEPSKV